MDINEKLIISAQNRDFLGVVECINSGADIDAKNDLGRTALMYASMNGDNNIIEYLIRNNEDPNVRDNNGNTPLIWAIRNGHLESCKLLIEKGADVNKRDNSGKTALDYQKDRQEQYKNNEMIQLLKDTSTNNLFESIQAYSLHEEGRDFIIEHIKESLANGADINCVKDCTIEHIDEESGICYIENIYATYNLKSATPLILAVDNRNYDLSKFFIENGADVNIKNKEGETALDIALKAPKSTLIDGKLHPLKDNENLKNLIISKGGKRGIEIKSKIKAKAKTKQKSNDFGMSM